MAFGTIAAMAAPAVINTIGNAITGKNNRRHSVDMWKMEQEYNKPVNQMARLENAGINPHLAFSSGNINNVASSAPQTMAIMPGQLSTADMMTDKNREQSTAQTSLAVAKKTLTEWQTSNETAKTQLNDLITKIQKGRFNLDKNGEIVNKKIYERNIKEYAEGLNQAELAEVEARRLVANMESDLAELNLTSNQAPAYKIIVEIFNQMGFDVSNLLSGD